MANWSTFTSLLHNRLNSGAATGSDGLIYVAGGGKFPSPTDYFETYAPLLGGNWSLAPLLPHYRFGLSFVFGVDGYLYAIGGGGHVVYKPGSLVMRYDTKLQTWAIMAELPATSVCLTAAVGPENKIYAVTLNGANVKMFAYNPPSPTHLLGEWISKPAPALFDTPTRALTGLDGNIYLTDNSNWAMYDGQWHNLPSSSYLDDAAMGVDGNIYIISSNQCNIFKPVGNGVEIPVQNLLNYHTPPMAITSAEGHIYIATGFNSSQPANSFNKVEKYGPLKAPDFAPNCKALWRFDEQNGPVVIDSKGNNNGTVIGNAVHATNGRVGNSIILNGTNQYININNAAAINFGASSFTMEGWIKWIPANGNSAVTPILDKRSQVAMGKYKGYHLFITAAGKLGVQLANGITYTNYGAEQTTIPANTWTHIAVTIDRNSTTPGVTLYVNSILDKTFVPLSGNITNTTALTIGKHSFNNTYFKGELDELALYNRALKWAEIRAVFLAGKEGKQ